MADDTDDTEEKEAPAPIPAATVLLLRDGTDGMEVFMVRRATKMDFAAGALVFPGGKVDPPDRAPFLRKRCGDVSDVDDYQLALRVAAVRETFEECGVLLARPHGEKELVPEARVQELETKYRDALTKDEIGIDAMITAENLDLACDLLVYYAHWITPVIRPKRFDTHFYLAPAPKDQVPLHDGSESLDSLWTKPQAAIDSFIAGGYQVMFPTYCNLIKLDRSKTVEEALDAARAAPVITVLGQHRVTPEGERHVVIPKAAGYGVTEVPDRTEPSGKRIVEEI
jgi:8-oxo-dGTP pyrophosphatase MutT (NUDIX family)